MRYLKWGKELLLLTLFGVFAFAETPPSAFTTIKGATDGTKIGNTGASLNVNVTGGGGGGGGTVTQGPQGVIGSPWFSFITNFPSSFGVTQTTSPWVISGAVTQSGSWNTGRTWILSSGTDSVNVGNFPATQPVSGTVAVTQSTSPWVVSSSVAGLSKVNLARNVYTSTNVTTSAYVQLLASTADTTNQINIFDSSGQTLVLAVGGSGSEVDQIYITPGGNGTMNLGIPSGSRVSVKAVSATANVGELDISFLK